jgi:2-keto-4-pentenoate hydratase
MSDGDQSRQAARFLLQERRAFKPLRPLPEPFAPTTVDEAYTIQTALNNLMSGTYGPVAGYKIGLTTPVMQQMVGLAEPVAGAILATTVHHSPSTLRCADFTRLGIECEIAVRLGTALPATRAPYMRTDILAAIDAVMPAFELIDDRNTDYTQLPTLALSLISDNVWNAGVVLGSPVTHWRTIDLAAVHGRLVINGKEVGVGQGYDVMGHPAEAIVWLANLFARQGKGLAQGMVIMTGSIIPTKFVNTASEVRFVVDDLGEVSLRTLV